MLHTPMAVLVCASVILADPIFKGLAIALMAGEIASLLISRMAVPAISFYGEQTACRQPCTSYGDCVSELSVVKGS